ncbi:MAG: PAS domain S-box protein [Gemmataceae bacterium]
MALQSQSNTPPVRVVGTSPPRFDREVADSATSSQFTVGWLWLGLVLLLYLVNPATWHGPALPVWSPPAGLTFILVAWFGWRTALSATLTATGLLLLQQGLTSAWLGVVDGRGLVWIATDGVLTLLEAFLAWWLYHQIGRGKVDLNDPRSATLFILLVPGLAAAGAALVRLLVAWPLRLPEIPTAGPGLQLAVFWFDRALGVLVVAPPLLVLFTPWLKSRRWLLEAAPVLPTPPASPAPEPAVPTAPFSTQAATHPMAAQPARAGAPAEPEMVSVRLETLRLGDVLEIVGLAVGASLLGLILSRLHGRRELLGWQLWGVQILLIVWASLRQGLRGGTIAATAATAMPLLLRRFTPPGQDALFFPLLQAHLVAQCSAALLVSAASSWVRLHETGYRQVVAHVPVVIYSARFRPEKGRSGRLPRMDPGLESALPVIPAEITLVSAACVQLLGRPPELLLGDYQHWLSCVHPEDRVVLQAALEQLERQRVPVTCEYRMMPSTTEGEPGSNPPGSVSSATRLGDGWAESLPGRGTACRWLRDTLAPHRTPEGHLIGWEGVLIDITEQRLLADDLRRTTSMFHALIANLPMGVFFIQGPQGNPIFVNARARQLLGTREDNAGTLDYLPRIYRLHRPDGSIYPAEELPVYLALKQGRTTMRDDIVVHRPDGRRVPLVTWAAPVHLSQRAAPDCAVWVLEDLTALHQAEAARKASEGRLRAIIETMAEGLLVHDDKGLITGSNSAATSLFQIPPDELVGRGVFDLGWTFLRENGSILPPQDHPTEVALRTGRPVRHVVLGLALKSAGIIEANRWLLVNAMPLGQGAGGGWSERGAEAFNDQQAPFTRLNPPVGVITTFTDLTAYYHAREAIRNSEERYRGLIEALPLALIQTDQALRLIYSNPFMQHMSGYELAEIADPQQWGQVVHPDDLAPTLETAGAALEGHSGRREIRFRSRDGADRVCLALFQPLHRQTTIAGITILVVDITRERHLERELDRSRRLELIGRLSSGVAHDFNNLLGVVLNLADLAQGHLPPEHPVHADLQRISEAGQQAASLATQLLSFSKQRPLPSRRLELEPILRRTVNLLRSTLPRHIELAADFQAEHAAVQADETQVQQVLMNLCLNARDAMPEGGTLRVSTRRVGVDESRQKTGRAVQQICLRVEDTGKGMADEVRQRIFEPFFSTREGGTGLGLAVVQQIIESYGGRILVSSQVDQGSCFEVYWPEV